MLYSISCGKWAAFEFLGGAFLADLHLLRCRNPQSFQMTFWGSKVLIVVIQVAIVLAAGWIMSWPPNASDITSSYVYLRDMAPQPFQEKETQTAFWFSLSAFFLVWMCGHASVIRRVLESHFSQYMGRISFAFYIIQHPILNLVMYQLHGSPTTFQKNGQILAVGSGLKGLIGVDTVAERMLCWFLGLIATSTLLVWAADVFTRAVDIPFVQASRYLEAKVCIDAESQAYLGSCRCNGLG
jgi:peptidoglycan/LPS O-acetylase OafA/YrhL